MVNTVSSSRLIARECVTPNEAVQHYYDIKYFSRIMVCRSVWKKVYWGARQAATSLSHPGSDIRAHSTLPYRACFHLPAAAVRTFTLFVPFERHIETLCTLLRCNKLPRHLARVRAWMWPILLNILVASSIPGSQHT